VDVGKLHIDTALTNVSVAYRNAAFVADKIFPAVPVASQSDRYFKAGKHNLRADDDLRRPGAEANEIEWTYSNEPYYADGHALRQAIPDPWRANAGGMNMDVDATEQLTDKLLLNQEIGLFNTLTGAGGLTAVDLAAAQWDNDTIDPIKRIDLEKEAIGKKIGLRPNVLLLSRPVFRGLRNNAKVTGRITGASELRNATVSLDQLADALELEEVIVADAVKQTVREGQADVLDYVWGKYALLFRRPKTPGLRTVSLGYHFVWQTGNNGQLVKRYRQETRESDIIEVQKYYDQKIVAAEAGTLFSNVVA
jgi:hypothetical protein